MSYFTNIIFFGLKFDLKSPLIFPGQHVTKIPGFPTQRILLIPETNTGFFHDRKARGPLKKESLRGTPLIFYG